MDATIKSRIKPGLAAFTLIELLVALLIIVILMTFILPFSRQWQDKQELNVASAQIHNALLYARNEALINGVQLQLKPMENDWRLGAELVKEATPYQPEQVLYQWRWHHLHLTMDWQGMASKHYIIFDSQLEQSKMSGHFILKSQQGESIKWIINRIGHIREVIVS